MKRRRSIRRSRVLLVLPIVLLASALMPAAVWVPAATAAPRLTLEPADPGTARAATTGSGILAPPRSFADLAGVRVSPMLFAAPASYDLRASGRVSPVRDQGPLGTCWAFATFASLESSLLPGETWDFSEDSLAWFHGFDTDGYNGGQYLQSSACLLRWRGPFTKRRIRITTAVMQTQARSRCRSTCRTSCTWRRARPGTTTTTSSGRS